MKAAILVMLAAAACRPATLSEETAEAAKHYPDAFALYSSDQGVYRGCGPSGGVCHNSNEFPNLSSLGSIVDNIGRDCNQKRTDLTTIHDLCEQEGDRFAAGGAKSEIAWIEVADAAARQWRFVLRDSMQMGGSVRIERGGKELYAFADYTGTTAVADPMNDHAVIVSVPPPPPPVDDDESYDFASVFEGVPGDTSMVRAGDPNRNGTFGAELDGKLIKAGDPTRSYLMSRLLDPTAGPLMPRANCCHWSKPAVRAMYCWIEGLKADASNAYDKIDYEHCSTGPSVELLYPEPGPTCEQQGLCPVEAAPEDDNPSFHNVYARVLVGGCAGTNCHGSGPVANVDFSSEQRAFDTLAMRVVPGSPQESKLYTRIDPALCKAPGCTTMPLGRAPLVEAKRALVRAWIEMGAQR